jgi:adenosylcobyric acid synthase
MNPLLLKPTSDKNSQVVLHGKQFGNQSADQYFKKEG